MTAAPEEALSRSQVFEMLSPAEVAALAKLCRSVSWRAGEVIFREGDPGASLFVLTAGEVEVLNHHRGAEKVMAVLAAPAAFGEMVYTFRLILLGNVEYRGQYLVSHMPLWAKSSFGLAGVKGFSTTASRAFAKHAGAFAEDFVKANPNLAPKPAPQSIGGSSNP